ncbi:MAG: hypothetical protein Q9224_002457, partial [Gallowayella concinna]
LYKLLRNVMGILLTLLCTYLLGGLSFLPLLVGLVLLHAHLTFPNVARTIQSTPDGESSLGDSKDDGKTFRSVENLAGLGEKFQRGHEPDVAAGYFAVCREYVPGGVNGKPPERTTPAGAIVAPESPSVYQSMYRSIFDRKQGPTLDAGKGRGNVKPTRRARNVFFVVLRHGHLMLYDDVEQLEVRHVISLEHHNVSIYGGEDIPEGELWIKRNAICLSRNPGVGDMASASKPFYFFSENCSEKEDFYFALLQNQEVKPGNVESPPRPLQFETKDIITLVQQLHSSEEQLQTRWINALVGRLFLAMYKTPEIEDFIRLKITKKIARVKKPAFLSGIVLRKIDMGESAPYITNPRLRDLTVDGDCCAEADIKYRGNFRIEIATTARIDLGARFKVREVNLVLAAVVKRLEGHVLVKIKPPPSNRLWISFETMPDMELSIEPLVSSRQITYGVILRQIESRIREVIAETVVLPHWDDSPFSNTSHQPFRGGIWRKDLNVDTSANQHTEVPDEAVQDEPEAFEQAAPPPASPRGKDDRTMSMPVLSDSAIPAAPHPKAAVSDHDGLDKSSIDPAIGSAPSSVQTPSAPPKAIRSRSFASAADPLVSMDHANIPFAKNGTMRMQHPDATSAMKAISHRPRPTSPIDIPSTALMPDTTSSIDPKAEGTFEREGQQSISSSPAPLSSPPTPTSITSTRSLNHSLGTDTVTDQVHQQPPTVHGKKQSIGAIGSATAAAAKSWGWSVLSRAKEQKQQHHGGGAGTPESPIGRGRPLPPPGQPLPPPEKSSMKVAQNGSAKRKPVPAGFPLSRRQSEASVRSEKVPPLPSRRRQPPTTDELEGQESLLVVGIPSESQPTSPQDDDRKTFLAPPIEGDMAKKPDMLEDPAPAILRSGEEFVEKRESPNTPASKVESDGISSTLQLQKLGMSKGYAGNNSRNVDMSRSENDLQVNIRKATSIEETAPKRKHVRACIVYTWDHKSSQSFWAGMKVQPILADEVQTFKALITVHKILQEGHPIAVKDAQANVNWLESLTRGVTGEGLRGYGPLLRDYVYFLMAKLAFHRQHPEFNGLFEYEEYISLKSINDPNEGYETISDLMTLQDQIDSFQKLIFAHFRGGANNECRISALVPLVQESYGIYKFITSMLRAMHTTTGDDDALSPLRGRYDTQHYRLLKFYYECSNLRYLTSLITVPKLPQEPPNLLAEDEDRPALPRRPARDLETREESAPTPPPPPPAAAPDPEPMNEFWKDDQRRQQEGFDAEQRRLQEQWNQQQYQQQLAQQQLEREYEEQRRQQAEHQRMAQEQLMQQQLHAQTQGRMAELERENLNARAQYEQDQLMLQQYDRRMKDLENQLNQLNSNFGQQTASKDDQIRALQEQVNTWRSKYEALAKLYSQLRSEHLDLLQKFKGVRLKAESAQEAINKREKLEREIKTKNLELADMIRERDRALHEKDRVTGGNREEVEKLKRDHRLATERADNAERAKGSELSSMLAKYNREMADLEEALRAKSRALDDVHSKFGERDGDLERSLREKEEELEIYKSGMDQTLLELNELRMNGGDTDKALDEQIDQVLLGNIQKINDIIDSVLQSGVQRVDDALYELDSTMQAGNQNASAPYVLSQIEKASSSATEFSTAFNNFIADGPNSPHAEIIRTINVFSGSIADVLSNTKGLTRFATEERKSDQLISAGRQSALSTLGFFRSLQSFRLEGMEDTKKTDVVINNNHEVQMNLQKLSKLADAFAPKSSKLTNTSGDLGDLVDRELTNAAKAIDAAAERLNKMMKKSREGYSTYELRIHDSILEAAIAVTNAIAQLIKAATASQQEIVKEGRGSSSRTAFYKKNNRWTEGLISAAKAVASSTNTLIETADGVISGRNSPEQLIVASNDVTASTAQLVAASRVKANFGSRTQDRLEEASKAVGKACRSLVRQVQDIIAQRNRDEGEDVDYGKLSGHEFKVREMEQQVEILQLENNLAQARQRLGEMRKISYQED